MSKIVYLGFYDEPDGGRNISPAAVTVMEYVNKVLGEIQKDALIVSPAEDKNGKYRPREEKRLSDHTRVVFLESLKQSKNIFCRAMRRFRQKKFLWKELNSIVQDGDTLIVYHSIYLMDIVKKLRRKKRIKFILQFCEVYADVTGIEKDRKKELSFAQTADAYIFASDLLDQQINQKHKISLSLYGTYDVDNIAIDKLDDGCIHCIYAGTFDPRKGGAVAAAAAGEFLDDRYHIHILGFGTEYEKKMLIKAIEDTTQKSKCKVTYDGLLLGNDYIRFLRKCHIGLSSQNPKAAFNATSFPSKVLTYLSNGLQVVSIKMPVLEQSKINKLLTYYTEDTPKALAEAIKSVDINKFKDSREVIKNLNAEFKNNLEGMIKALENNK